MVVQVDTNSSSPTTGVSSSDFELSPSIEYSFGVFLCLELVVGVTGNLLTLWVIVTNKYLRTIPNIYIANLAVADLILLCVNLPTTIIEFLRPTTSTDFYYCRYTAPVNIMTMIAALTSIGAVGLNRYLHLCLSKAVYNKLTQPCLVVLSIAAIWIWSFCIVLPPMVGFGTFGYHAKFHTCFFSAYDHESWLYGTVFCCCLGVFPTVIASTYFYGRILVMLKRNQQNLLRHYNNKVVSIYEAKNSSASDKSHLIKRNQRQLKRIYMLIVVFVIVIISWLPIAISFMIDKENKLPSLVYVCFCILAWTNSCVNIFIYAGMNTTMRQAYAQIFKCTCFQTQKSTDSSRDSSAEGQ